MGFARWGRNMGASAFDSVVMALTKRKMKHFFRMLIKEQCSFSPEREGDGAVPSFPPAEKVAIKEKDGGANVEFAKLEALKRAGRTAWWGEDGYNGRLEDELYI